MTKIKMEIKKYGDNKIPEKNRAGDQGMGREGTEGTYCHGHWDNKRKRMGERVGGACRKVKCHKKGTSTVQQVMQ